MSLLPSLILRDTSTIYRNRSLGKHLPDAPPPAPLTCAVVRGGGFVGTVADVSPADLSDLVRLRRARDLMDRDYAEPLDVPALARIALMSPGHFQRSFRAAFGETPYSYLMTRRIERAKALLRRGDLSVTEVCMAVGCTSLGSFSSRFTELVGETPSAYRARDHAEGAAIPACIAKIHTRPVRNGEARATPAP